MSAFIGVAALGEEFFLCLLFLGDSVAGCLLLVFGDSGRRLSGAIFGAILGESRGLCLVNGEPLPEEDFGEWGGTEEA